MQEVSITFTKGGLTVAESATLISDLMKYAKRKGLKVSGLTSAEVQNVQVSTPADLDVM